MIECKGLACAGTVFFSLSLTILAARAAERFDLIETTIAETQQAIREHRVSCHQIIEEYLHRIREYDQTSRLNALVLVNPNALAEADKFDLEFNAFDPLQPKILRGQIWACMFPPILVAGAGFPGFCVCGPEQLFLFSVWQLAQFTVARRSLYASLSGITRRDRN